MTTVRLGLMPLWNPEGKPNAQTHTALVIQAYHTAGYKQRVTISGPSGVPGLPKTVESNPATAMGTAFWSEEINLGAYAPQSVPRYFDVTIQYTKDKCTDNCTWSDPAVLAVQGTQIGPSCVTAYALANDVGDDADYNDTVVSLSLFPYSRDLT